jgi:hypothetical protein
VRIAGVVICAALAACAPTPVEVREAHSAAEAARLLPVNDGKAWLVHDGVRTELPPGARIEGKDELFLVVPKGAPSSGTVRKLQDGDSVVEDAQGNIVAIQGKNGSEQRFEPGTARMRPGTDEIVIQAAAASNDRGTPLAPADRVETIARYGPGQVVPGQGKVEERRKVGLLILGGLFFVMGYAPAFYVGATSTLKQDRVLLLPILGPWIDLLARPKCESGTAPVDPCIGESLAKVAIGASGIVQAVGTVLFAVGLPAESAIVKNEAQGTELRIGPFGARGTF